MTLTVIRQRFAFPQLVLGLLNIIINSFFIHAARQLKKFQILSYKIILCLTISNITSGFNMITEEILTLAVIRDETSKLRIMCRLMFFFITQFSGVMMLAVAFDRYVHMKHLNKYQQVMNGRTLFIFIVSGFLTATFCVAALMLGFVYDAMFCSSLALFANALILFLAILVIYARAYKQLIDRSRNLNLKSRNTAPRRNANKDFATATLVILVSLLISFVPYFVLSTLTSYNAEIDKIAETPILYTAWLVSIILLKVHTVTDALLLMFFDRKMRIYAKAVFCKIN